MSDQDQQDERAAAAAYTINVLASDETSITIARRLKEDLTDPSGATGLQILLATWKNDAVQALIELLDVDPAELKAVQKAQNCANNCIDTIATIKRLIRDGETAERLAVQKDQEGLDDEEIDEPAIYVEDPRGYDT